MKFINTNIFAVMLVGDVTIFFVLLLCAFEKTDLIREKANCGSRHLPKCSIGIAVNVLLGCQAYDMHVPPGVVLHITRRF